MSVKQNWAKPSSPFPRVAQGSRRVRSNSREVLLSGERGGALRALIKVGKAYQEGVPVSEYMRERIFGTSAATQTVSSKRRSCSM
jgi:hypothetical protein